jgi:hypothetical protein
VNLPPLSLPAPPAGMPQVGSLLLAFLQGTSNGVRTQSSSVRVGAAVALLRTILCSPSLWFTFRSVFSPLLRLFFSSFIALMSVEGGQSGRVYGGALLVVFTLSFS